MFWERLEDAVKVSSAPAEAVAFLVPYYPGNEHYVNCIKTLRTEIFLSGFGNVEASGGELLPEVFDLGEEEVNVSLLHNRDENTLVAIQRLPNEGTSVNLAALVDIAGNTSRPDILVKVQNLIHDFHTLLFNVSNRLSVPKS